MDGRCFDVLLARCSGRTEGHERDASEKRTRRAIAVPDTYYETDLIRNPG